MIKNEKTIALLLWGLVAYATAILLYYTLKVLGHDADYISAFGSVVSATATFFAAYVAIALFNDWKKQHNAQIKYSYLKEVLTISRDNLILIAPILNNVIVSGQAYLYKDEISKIDFMTEILDNTYSSHKKIALTFKEYNLVFKDDVSYLVFLRFSAIIEKSLIHLINIDKNCILNSEKLEEVSQQLHIIAIPEKIENGSITSYITHEMTVLQLCEQVELYYDLLIKHLASYKLKE